MGWTDDNQGGKKSKIRLFQLVIRGTKEINGVVSQSRGLAHYGPPHPLF